MYKPTERALLNLLEKANSHNIKAIGIALDRGLKSQERWQCIQDTCSWCRLGYSVYRKDNGIWLHTVPTAPEPCYCLAQGIRKRFYDQRRID